MLFFGNTYVPLRVWVEVAISQEKDELGQMDKSWEMLEQRRATSLRGPLKEEQKSDKRKRYPIGERLEKARRLVILGDPGSGKTTLTRWIATAYLLRLKNDIDFRELPDVATLPDVDWLPIIVRCRDLDLTCLGGSLDDVLKHTLRKAELSDSEATDLQELLRLRLKDGKALLMLDGLDEITDSATRACFCQQLEQIVRAFPAAPIIATSRIVGYREMGYKLGQDFEHLTLADLTPEEKDDFARRWCALTELPERCNTATEELIHDIHSTDRIERLTGNPMLLTTMALVKRKIGKLPRRRAELYWEAVQVLLNWRREVDEPLDGREAIPQLEYLAYAMCDLGVQQLRQDEILDLFAHMREDYPNVHAVRNRSPEDFLKRLEARTGIVVEAGHVPHLGMLVPVYEFRHLTFQEYLAARALVDGRFPNRDPKNTLAENVAPLASCTTENANTNIGLEEASVVENWREALRLCIAICTDDDVDYVLRAILTPQIGDPSSTVRARTIQAALCMADEPNASEQIAEQVFLSLAQQVGHRDGAGDVRSNLDATVIELSKTHWADALRAILLDKLHRCELDLQPNIGGLIGMMGESIAPRETEKLDIWLVEQVRRLQESADPDATYTALSIMQLAFHKRIELVNGLVDALLARLFGSVSTAFAAAWALGWLNRNDIWQPNTSEMETIVAFLSNQDSNPKAVEIVTWIFQKKQYKRAGKPLIFWLGYQLAEIRSAVALALGAIKSEKAVEPLIARLKDKNADVRSMVAQALGAIKSEKAVEPLIARMEDKNAKVRSAVALALGAINSEKVVEPLMACLKDENADVRSAVAQALGAIKSEKAVEPLMACLKDKNADVRSAVAQALGAIKSEKAVEPLMACLKDKNADVRSAVAQALGAINSDKTVEPLIARLEHKNADVRSAVAQALGAINSKKAVEPLIARLEDKNAKVRSSVAHALGAINSEKAVEPLIACLKDKDADVRSAVAQALGAIKSEKAVEQLIARLKDENADVQSSVAHALGAINSEKAVEPLIARLKDKNADVRRDALNGLAQDLEKIDRKLLSRDLDGIVPFLDPREPINDAFAKRAASKFELTVEDVRKRFETLAARFGLRLTWRTDDHRPMTGN